MGKALHGDLPESIIGIDFRGWPVLTVKLEGRHFDGTLTAKVMEGLVALQKNIYKSYAYLRYNRATTTALRDEEKAALEFTVRVEAGCSKTSIDLREVIENLGKSVVDKMEPRHLVITILGAALLWGATVAWKDYLNAQVEQHRVDALVHMDESETEKLRLLAEAFRESREIQTLRREIDETRNLMLKGMIGAEAVDIDGARVDGEMLAKIVRKPRSTAVEVRLDGNYKVRKLDSSNPDHYKIEVLGDDGQKFVATMDAGFAAAREERELLDRAIWDHSTVYLKINAREVRGEIRGAIIIGVETAQ